MEIDLRGSTTVSLNVLCGDTGWLLEVYKPADAGDGLDVEVQWCRRRRHVGMFEQCR